MLNRLLSLTRRSASLSYMLINDGPAKTVQTRKYNNIRGNHFLTFFGADCFHLSLTMPKSAAMIAQRSTLSWPGQLSCMIPRARSYSSKVTGKEISNRGLHTGSGVLPTGFDGSSKRGCKKASSSNDNAAHLSLALSPDSTDLAQRRRFFPHSARFHPYSQRHLARLLRDWGYSSQTVPNGAQGSSLT